MADDTKKSEADAQDLLSLWGQESSAGPSTGSSSGGVSTPAPGGSSASSSSTATPKTSPPPPPPPRPAEPKPVEPKPAESKPQTQRAPVAPVHSTPRPIQPAPAPWEAPTEPVESKQPPAEPTKSFSKEKPHEEIFEGEIVESKPKKVSHTKSPEKKSEEISKESTESLPPEFSLPENSAADFLDEPPSFSEKLDDFLAELHLTKKHLYYGVGCFVAVILLIVGGIWAYGFFKNRGTTSPSVAPPSQIPIAALPQPGSSPATTPDTSGQANGIASGTIIGSLPQLNPQMIGDTGITSTILIGTPERNSNEIGTYILTLRKLQNAYAINTNTMLNASTDRRARIEGYLALLNSLYNEGSKNVDRINQEVAALTAANVLTAKQQQTDDQNFFDQLSAFNGATAQNILNDFISVTKDITEQRARFKALQKILNFYALALPRVQARIKDISLNEEALIKGIKVYDVTGSDLQLIIPVQGPAQPTTDSFGTPAFPLIPINPVNVDTGHDYITPRGGGF